MLEFIFDANKQIIAIKSVHSSSFLCGQVDVTDAAKTAEAFLKIASVYKEENNDIKHAVLDSIGETHSSLNSTCFLFIIFFLVDSVGK